MRRFRLVAAMTLIFGETEIPLKGARKQRRDAELFTEPAKMRSFKMQLVAARREAEWPQA